MSGLHLQRVDDTADEVAAVAAAHERRVPLDVLLGDLNRRAGRVRGARVPGRAVHEAWRFDGRDQLDLRWWPQGVSTSDDAGGPDAERRVAVVSWYAKELPWDDGRQGSRVSFLDLDTGRYRHVLLVRPRPDGSVEPLRVHAGGVVWHRGHLHVAATGRGFFTCRLADVVRLRSRADGFGYRYALPVRWQYRAGADEGVKRLNYSFLSLDHAEHALLVGEYTNDPDRIRRLARIPLDPATGLPELGDGGRAALRLVGTGPRRMQGAVDVGGRLFVSVSQGRSERGSVFAGAPDALREHRHATPMGNEDLAYAPADDLLYSVSEHPTVRWLFAMRRTWFD